jgi:F-type H+-transporting ATPase subunit beta
MTVTENAATTPAAPELKDGRVVAIAGPVVDVEFPLDALPEINTAVSMTIERLPQADRRTEAGHDRPQHR